MTFIRLTGATLDLPIYDVHGRSLKKQVMRYGRRNRIAEGTDGVVVVRAIDNVTFEFVPGDHVGLVGRNGAGKSSLLRTMAGIYTPTAGEVSVSGKVVPLLDIGLGMDENSTGRQNIRLRGLLLGMSDAEIKSKQKDIADFSELGDYLDLPLRTYSSGMRVRLAFAVSTAVDADILLLDEVMGVGDASFLHKASDRLQGLRSRAQIVVLAMHSNEEIRRTCNKALWLERGGVRAFGPVNDVLAEYEAASH
jgi:ABC-type polysaccharide/polyol phosphate transport system ATPase subunit